MPAKKPKGPARPVTEPAVKDVPRGGFTCQSYQDGHNVHYIPVMKVVPDLEPVRARIECSDDQIALVIGKDRTAVYSHNPAAIGLLIQELGSACRWYPTLNLACWPGKAVRHWASLALAPVEACGSAEEAYLAELAHWS